MKNIYLEKSNSKKHEQKMINNFKTRRCNYIYRRF